MSPKRVPNYLVQSILVTFLCCPPFGLAGVIYSLVANRRLEKNDLPGAYAASQKAKLWAFIGFAIGFLFLFFYLFSTLFSALGET